MPDPTHPTEPAREARCERCQSDYHTTAYHDEWTTEFAASRAPTPDTGGGAAGELIDEAVLGELSMAITRYREACWTKTGTTEDRQDLIRAILRWRDVQLTTARTEAARLEREREEARLRAHGAELAVERLEREAERPREMFQRLREAMGVSYPTAEEVTAAALDRIATLAARDAELAGVREELDEALQREQQLRAAGGQLANCAYNLAQQTTLDEDARRSLDSCRRQWDAILKRHSQTDDAARSGAGKER